MRSLVFIAFLLFSLTLSAKKAPKWKGRNFKTSSSGIRYDIKKPGKGEAVQTGDVVRLCVYVYNYHSKKRDSALHPFSEKTMENPFSMVMPDDASPGNGLIMSARLLKKGGEGFFIIPPRFLLNESADSCLCFIRVLDVTPRTNLFIPTKDSVKTDSVQITVNDPGQKFFGDTLFTMMKLLEVPQMSACGTTPVNVAFKFEMTWFDQGTQRKNILVFVECPESYGKDYFVAGKSYMITCVPMLEEFKKDHNTMNHYSLEKLDTYYGLRIKKM